MSSPDDYDARGIVDLNREEASFGISGPSPEEEAEQHNYSSTARWRQRLETLKNWKEEWDSKANPETFPAVLENRPFPNHKALFLTEQSEHKSALGEMISGFCECADKSVSSWQRFNPVGDKENSQGTTTQLDDMYKALKEGLFDAVNAKASSCLAKGKNLLLEHQRVKAKLSVNASKGNQTLTSEGGAESHKSLDDKRFNLKKIPSPSDIVDLIDAVDNDDLRQQLSSSVSEKLSETKKKTLRSLQDYVSNLFKLAQETYRKDHISNTVKDILAWKEGAKVDETKQFGRPPTDCDCETQADQPILHAIVC